MSTHKKTKVKLTAAQEEAGMALVTKHLNYLAKKNLWFWAWKGSVDGRASVLKRLNKLRAMVDFDGKDPKKLEEPKEPKAAETGQKLLSECYDPKSKKRKISS